MVEQAATGRIDKRNAVMAAAFDVFSREGYQQAHVDQIAARAKVAKATVYNHFGDKETLFRAAIEALSEAALARNLAAVARLDEAGADPGPALTDVGVRLIDCYCEEQSWALRRLLYAETPRFPDLVALVQDRVAVPVVRALADRLARLSLAGLLATDDADAAAEQFTALLTGPLEARSRYGTRRVSRAERRAVAERAVTTFLRAYSPA
ncbi:TetR/AcrR family transcriptional regulator [Stackebrandtia nassauensis]|uniref:Transcriptional regulator, TetR family n=1 Tax=Stackebrandtia nassauensis (strain DSM 44728 / CIP 108903 / NRRL B-16338 / NBRC 102104 / LLR-40K-21) TaxID=446470 RepID=D3QAN6_STANL|nr:TetR/AcrR family transcriptional regulator [Stackebrandtia nassauensis]ADD44682.1 transcriptional regulator, TetR family [Stackebrandtia nassauensis DSM 44728]